jgi:hypothetical protein
MISAQAAVLLLRYLLTGFLVVAMSHQLAAAPTHLTQPVALVLR